MKRALLRGLLSGRLSIPDISSCVVRRLPRGSVGVVPRFMLRMTLLDNYNTTHSKTPNWCFTGKHFDLHLATVS